MENGESEMVNRKQERIGSSLDDSSISYFLFSIYVV
jgi:hypothetical protein